MEVNRIAFHHNANPAIGRCAKWGNDRPGKYRRTTLQLQGCKGLAQTSSCALRRGAGGLTSFSPGDWVIANETGDNTLNSESEKVTE